MNSISKDYKKIVLVYANDILIFSRDTIENSYYLQKNFKLFIDNEIIISEKKMKFCKAYINFLGMISRDGKIRLQPQIAKQILEISNKLDNTNELQKFLGLINYERYFIKNLKKKMWDLYMSRQELEDKHSNNKKYQTSTKIN